MSEPALPLDLAGTDLHAEAAELRERGPLTRVELPPANGDPVVAWAVTCPDLLRGLLRDSRVSKNPRSWSMWRDGHIDQNWPLWTWVGVENMFTATGIEHRRLRSLVSSAFTRRGIEALAPRITDIAERLLDIVSEGSDPVDLRAEFTNKLPSEVINDLFGVPERHRPLIAAAISGLFATDSTPQERERDRTELSGALWELVDDKRVQPGDDLTTRLLHAHDGGDQLTETELIDTLFLIIGAGHETTVNLLHHAILALLTHPEQRRSVRDGHHSWADVVEETLRWQSPVFHLPLRFATEDIDCDGVLIREGEAILASYGAANRSPRWHEQPDTFRVSRASADHLGFGHGIHYCLGAPLARLEATIALPALFERFPRLALAEPPEELVPVPSFISNAHRALPVLLNPS